MGSGPERWPASTRLSIALVFCVLVCPWSYSEGTWRQGAGIPFMSLRLFGVLGLLALTAMRWRYYERMHLVCNASV